MNLNKTIHTAKRKFVRTVIKIQNKRFHFREKRSQSRTVLKDLVEVKNGSSGVDSPYEASEIHY